MLLKSLIWATAVGIYFLSDCHTSDSDICLLQTLYKQLVDSFKTRCISLRFNHILSRSSFNFILYYSSYEVSDEILSVSQNPAAEVKVMTERSCKIGPTLQQEKERQLKTLERIINQGVDIVWSVEELRQELDDSLAIIEGHTRHALSTMLEITDDNLVEADKQCHKLQDDLNIVTELLNCGNIKAFPLKLKSIIGSLETHDNIPLTGMELMSMTEDSSDGADDSSEIFVVKEIDKYNVDTSDDKDVCGIRVVCGLPSGDIVITDC